MWQVTHDMWHMKRDKWHLTGDTWHMEWGEHSLTFQLSSYIGKGVKMFEDFEEKDDSVTLWLSDKGFYRTTPATPGLCQGSMILQFF